LFKKSSIILVSLIIIIVLMLSACTPQTPAPNSAPTPSPAPAPAPKSGPAVWKIQAATAGTYPSTNLIATNINEEIKVATDGRLSLEVYPLTGLGYAQADMVAAVGEGLLEGAEIWATHVTGDVPILDAVSVPGVFVPEREHAFLAAMTFNNLARPYFEEALLERNVVFITNGHVGPHELFTKKPVTSIADIKGLVVRTGGPTEAEAFKTWGASPSSIAIPEIAVALERGTVDGYMYSANGHYTQELYPMTPYCFELGWSTTTPMVMVNKDAWDALSKEDQRRVLSIFRHRYEVEYTHYAVGEEDVTYKEKLVDEGTTFYKPPANIVDLTVEAGQGAIDKWLNATGARGQELYDRLRVALEPYQKK